MNSADVSKLIGRYLLAAAEHFESSARLGIEKRAVYAMNAAADTLRELATDIGAAGPEGVRSFAALLNEPRNGVQVWAALHVLEVMDAPPDVIDGAFAVLERHGSGHGVQALGIRMRLKELKVQFGRSST